MRPRSKPHLKTGSQVKPFDSVLILPHVREYPAEQNKEYRYKF